MLRDQLNGNLINRNTTNNQFNNGCSLHLKVLYLLY